MIARTWKGAVRSEDANDYAAYMRATGVAAYAATPGNRGAWMLRRDAGDRTEFVMVTLWDAIDALEAFAGEDYDRAVFYPEDERFLIERDRRATHYQVAASVDGSAWNPTENERSRVFDFLSVYRAAFEALDAGAIADLFANPLQIVGMRGEWTWPRWRVVRRGFPRSSSSSLRIARSACATRAQTRPSTHTRRLARRRWRRSTVRVRQRACKSPPTSTVLRSRRGRLGLLGEQVVEELADGRRRVGADEARRRFAVPKDGNGGDALDPEARGQLRLGIDVYLDELELPRPLLHFSFDRGAERAAGTTPGRPEVDDDRQLA